MSNFLTICFKPCEPTPVNGYQVHYRRAGSGDELRVWPANFFPTIMELQAGKARAALLISVDPDGTQYEGYIFGDCGNGQLGVGDPWLTGDNESSGSEGCAPVAFVEGSLPNGAEGVPYSVDLHLTGDAPFVLGSVTKPAWMTVVLDGSTIHLTGTPDAEGDDLGVTIVVTNCDGADQDTLDASFDVVGGDGLGFISCANCSLGNRIDNVTWNGHDPLTVAGDFPVNSGQEIVVSHGVTGASHTLEIFATNDTAGSGTILAIDSAGALHCLEMDGSGHYTIPGFIIGLVNWSVHMDCEGICT